MEQEKKSYANSVRLVGYLKETTLEEKISQKDGRHFISGNITVALDEFNTHRIRFFVDEESKKYETVKKFLPNNTVSVASYLKSTPTANFSTAAAMSAKIWVMARLEEFASRTGEKEKTMTSLKGFSIGLVDPDKPFVPTASFEIDAYIENLRDEEEDGKLTGRLLVDAVIPAYKGLVYRIPLIAPVENNVAKFIKEKYKVGDTARLGGKLVAMRVQLVREDSGDSEFFGKSADQQYTTRFVRENIIESGPKTPIAQGADGCITTEAVKAGLALRETEMDKNGQRRNGSDNVPPAVNKSASSTVIMSPIPDEDDFNF